MIIDTIFGILIDLISQLVGAIFTALGQKPTGVFTVPMPLAFIIASMFSKITAIYAALLGWWIWRQVKG